MMTNPNPKYDSDVWFETMNRIMDRQMERMEAQIPKLIEARWNWWKGIIKGGKFEYVPDPIKPLRITDPLVCIEYNCIVGKARRMKTDPKIWVPDSLSRDPIKLAGAIAQAVIHFFRMRKGFDDWWHGIDELRRDELRAGLACDIAMSLPRHPEEAVIKYAQERTVPLEETSKPNPNWVDVDPVWVTAAMVPEGMPRLGMRVWEDVDRVNSEAQLDKKEIYKWLRATSLRMAQGKHVTKEDKNRFVDLARVVGWGDE